MATNDERVLASWRRNAAPWTRAVRERGIESRRLVTDRAVVEVLLAGRPSTLIDLGCGEGWLVRALAGHGVSGLGIDAVPELVDAARKAGQGSFRCLAYEDIAAGALDTRADAVACNFSLIGQEAVDGLLRAIPALLARDGRLVVQTLHPLMACGDAPYADGWREGSWAGIDGAFGDPAPWYFRTLPGWLRALDAAGLHLRELHEPLHPHSGKPASLILVADARD